METITLKEYESLTILYNEDGSFKKDINIKEGDRFLIREPREWPDKGDVVTVYEVIRVTNTGEESKPKVLKIC
jgi:hypothetical protein